MEASRGLLNLGVVVNYVIELLLRVDLLLPLKTPACQPPGKQLLQSGDSQPKVVNLSWLVANPRRPPSSAHYLDLMQLVLHLIQYSGFGLRLSLLTLATEEMPAKSLLPKTAHFLAAIFFSILILLIR